ncbi:hypothetical protein ACIQPQ_31415 [Streptomyces sp. NPDC091281]|uniref:hypothetical protein n=1 Tax=Streptomyces sp. NPDC091281 TaxID=3365985 RepID=UPI0037F73E1D
MTSTSHILEQIDGALEDWTVSEDAMRSQPPREEGSSGIPFQGFTPALYIEDEAGEWQEVGRVSSSALHFEPPEIDPEFARTWARFRESVHQAQIARARQASELFEVIAETLRRMAPAVEEDVRAVDAVMQAAQKAGLCDDRGKPLRPRDRPAWQSPYGPPRRR